eukprot:CAMPEP_0113887970 /NCGR_PEP_ID=MMETSP0780_2-20120614/12560_1 /TAXON_ID=652834 /ORGANISM="Palpitomonas bilix" /LENGTH=76 /DNA_ID=CAMNT_0000876663 /DNA_START=46 /DNA_END=276 /DNA_ORIENTATION=- /assembly_acc=CAM_ASM_000599
MSTGAKKSELMIAEAWDSAIEGAIRRFAIGGLAGGATALLFFRNPATRGVITGLGAGIGLGMAYAEAEREFARLQK